jgi:hypothetical protein
VNAAYNLSLSLSIPESLYHLLSFKPTHFVPEPTLEISRTHFDQVAHASDMITHSTKVAVESTIFTKTASKTVPSVISGIESENILDSSFTLTTPQFGYLELSPVITKYVGSTSYHSAPAGELSNSIVSSQDSTSVYQQESSAQSSLYHWSYQSSNNPTKVRNSKIAFSTNEIESTQTTKILTSDSSTTKEYAPGSIYFSNESKLEQNKFLQTSSSLFSATTITQDNVVISDSNQFSTTMEKSSSSELSQTSIRHLQTQTSSLLPPFHSSRFINPSSTDNFSSSVFSTNDFETAATIFPVDSSTSSATSLGRISRNLESVSNSLLSLKQTSILPFVTIVKHTASLTTTISSISSKFQPTSQSFSSHYSSLTHSMFLSSAPISTFSSTSFSSSETQVGHITSINNVQTNHLSSLLSSNASNLAVLSTMHTTLANSYTVPASVKPIQKSSVAVSSTLQSLSSSSNQLTSGLQFSDINRYHESEQTSSPTRIPEQGSYMVTDSFQVTELGLTTSPYSIPESSEYVDSLSTVTSALSVAKTKLVSKAKMKLDSSIVQTDIKVERTSTLSELLTSSNSLTKFLEPTETTTNEASMSMKPTLDFSNEITKLYKTSISSRGIDTSPEPSVIEISSSESFKRSSILTSDFVHSLTPLLPSSSERPLKMLVSLSSDGYNATPTITLTDDNTVLLTSSKSFSERLPKTVNNYESSSLSDILEPSVSPGLQHTITTPPREVHPTTNKHNDNSAERQKNTKTSIAIGAGVGGGIVLICIILIVVIIVIRKKNKKGKRDFFQVRLPPELFMTRSL